MLTSLISTQKIKRAATVKARIEGFKTAASQGKTKEKSNEEVQPLKQSTTSEESKVAVSNHFNCFATTDAHSSLMMSHNYYMQIEASLSLRRVRGG